MEAKLKSSQLSTFCTTLASTNTIPNLVKLSLSLSTSSDKMLYSTVFVRRVVVALT